MFIPIVFKLWRLRVKMCKEPEIIINGVNVGPGCAMTIRVAIECLAKDLRENGLGSDKHGKSLKDNYLARINDIRSAFCQYK